ncbi:MAG: BPSS1780 family membrane protein [Rhodoferax sp.]
MRLRVVKASAGLQWAREGVRTFGKQPLALSGLFFLFMAMMSVVGMLPVIGLPLAMTLLPTATLGLMAASREAQAGRFPMPLILFVGLRSGRVQALALLKLGMLYGAGFLMALGASALLDSGAFARLYLGGQMPTAEVLESADLRHAMWLFMGLHLPLSLTFWHAPALVFWDGVPLAKSLFFSWMACWRNFWAFTVFGLVWMAAIMGAVVTVVWLSSLLGNPTLGATLLVPAMLLLASMFFSSLYPSYAGCFEPQGTAKAEQ